MDRSAFLQYYCLLLVVALSASHKEVRSSTTPVNGLTSSTTLGDVGSTVINRDCIVGDWLPWTPCSNQCMPGGIQVRIRKIAIPATGNGVPCSSLREERSCNIVVPCETRSTDMTITISVIPGQTVSTTPSSDVTSTSQVTTPPTAGTPCTNKPDGHYQQAACSKEYYSCVAGIFIPRQCQGALVFDALMNRCDAPSNTYGCTGTLSTVPITNRTITTTTPAPEFDCTQLANGFYANPKAQNSCDNKYYACTNGITEVIFCPATLYFDQEVQSCQIYAYVPNCSGTPRTTVQTTTTTSTLSTQSVIMDVTGIDCQTLPSGNYPNPLSEPAFCSPIYYTCSDGTLIRRMCQMALYYDRRNNFCNFRDSIPDCTGGTTSTTTRRLADVTSPLTLPPVNFTCTYRADGFYANPAASCSPIYYSCTGGLARQLQCQAGLAFDQLTGACQSPNTLFVCTGTNMTTSFTRQTITAATGTQAPLPIDCTRLSDGLYADPLLQCSQIFYFCSNGIAMRFNCPGNLYYDAEGKTCAEFREIFLCTGTRSTPRPTTSMGSVTAPIFDCSQRTDGRYANPLEACSRIYFVCSAGTTTRSLCPENLFFDQLTMECRPNSTVVACGGIPVQTLPSTMSSSSSSSSTVEFDCAGLPNGLYADLRQPCNNYYFLCSAGSTYKQWCPLESFFNDVTKRCDQFANVIACNTSAATVRTTTQTVPISDVPTFSCTNRPDGNYPNPTVSCSTTYFVCVQGLPEVRVCPQQQVFDPETNMCNRAAYVRVCGGNPLLQSVTQTVMIPTVVTVSSLLSDVTTTPSTSFCDNLPDQSYPIPGRRCSKSYYECENGHTKKAACPKEKRFNPDKRDCDLRTNVPDCK
ncbi:TSP 1 and CBM 14 domain containing protein [Trichuris trichiura]|uniref:TSP 1 and CBM 14 domain containing protein n=1 Tax=Trichuris trichiura TaxID=36087 RepID=A0A077Z3K5_TRITR|nr:TSP 1 and CBM 14 domain containing protein [Trichuris trichiura]